MTIDLLQQNNHTVAVVYSPQKLITDIASALDFIMSTTYQTGTHKIVINKEALAEEFFILSTGLAGDILQKFVTYQVQLAIYGDFTHYTSKPLKDFIYESNKGRHIFFAATQEEALDFITKATN